jgi:hypothetical protein
MVFVNFCPLTQSCLHAIFLTVWQLEKKKVLFAKKRLKLLLEIEISNIMAATYVLRRDLIVPVLSVLTLGLIKHLFAALIDHIDIYMSKGYYIIV